MNHSSRFTADIFAKLWGDNQRKSHLLSLNVRATKRFLVQDFRQNTHCCHLFSADSWAEADRSDEGEDEEGVGHGLIDQRRVERWVRGQPYKFLNGDLCRP